MIVYKCFQCPDTPDEWLQVAEEFNKRWQFPNCVGAIDGKHIAIRPPPNSGSRYFNYKRFFSIVLLAVVDANYRFLYVDVGKNGRCSDGGVFADSDLRKALDDGTARLPKDDHFPKDDKSMPFCMVGDDAFPLRKYLMKPFPQRKLTDDERIFNYRLSRARRVVENAFGILAHRLV